MSISTAVEARPLGEVAPVAARHRWILWFPVVAAVAVTHLLYPDGLFGQANYMVMTVGAATAAMVGTTRQPAAWRTAWGCVALAVALSAVGDITYSLIGLNNAVTYVGPADAFWLTSYVALAIGVSSLIVGGHGVRRVDLDGLIDMGSFAVLAVIVVTEFTVVRDVMTNQSYPISTRTVWTAYPVFDAVLLGVIIQAMISRRLRGRSGVFLTCGVVLWLISDFASVLISDLTLIFNWLDVGWMLGAACLAVAAWPAGVGDAGPVAVVKAVRVTDARILMTLLPLLVPGVIKIWEFSKGNNPNPVPLFGATVTLVALAFARSTRLVRARNRQEQALERSTHFYAALAENSSDAVIVVDADGRILNDSPNLAAMLGQPGTPTTGMDVIALLNPVDRQGAIAVLDHWRTTNGVVIDADVQGTEGDGTARWFGVRAANLTDDPIVGGIVLNLRDITDRKRAEQELSDSAFHDSLTGLANRALFRDRLEHALERTARTGQGVAVVYLDLDGFKMVNDSRGHEAGDQVLRDVAARLSSVVRTIDTVSRLGGDEFAILIEDSPKAFDEAQTVAERVLQSLTAAFIVDDQHIVLSASIGIAVADTSCTASSMLRDADVAMYQAKTTGTAKWALYQPAMRTATLDRLELDNDLRQALNNHQLRLVYQPIIQLDTDMVVGFEALLRWDHPTRGTIPPATFIPIAENNGTIIAIGQWVLHQACTTAAHWQHTHPNSHLTMAVNLSARQIATPDIVDHVATALHQTGLTPNSLILEMTESVLVEDATTATERLQQLRALGVRLAIDDFGTGYSSLSYLRQFPIDILKIDKSFTDTITNADQIPPIIKGLLDLATTLHLATVAEGIEHPVQHDTLRNHHCDFGQGYLYAKPLTPDDATTFLNQTEPSQQNLIGTP